MNEFDPFIPPTEDLESVLRSLGMPEIMAQPSIASDYYEYMLGGRYPRDLGRRAVFMEGVREAANVTSDEVPTILAIERATSKLLREINKGLAHGVPAEALEQTASALIDGGLGSEGVHYGLTPGVVRRLASGMSHPLRVAQMAGVVGGAPHKITPSVVGEKKRQAKLVNLLGIHCLPDALAMATADGYLGQRRQVWPVEQVLLNKHLRPYLLTEDGSFDYVKLGGKEKMQRVLRDLLLGDVNYQGHSNWHKLRKAVGAPAVDDCLSWESQRAVVDDFLRARPFDASVVTASYVEEPTVANYAYQKLTAAPIFDMSVGSAYGAFSAIAAHFDLKPNLQDEFHAKALFAVARKSTDATVQAELDELEPFMYQADRILRQRVNVLTGALIRAMFEEIADDVEESTCGSMLQSRDPRIRKEYDSLIATLQALQSGEDEF